jgi:apolipoprotein N-acyltransferase
MNPGPFSVPDRRALVWAGGSAFLLILAQPPFSFLPLSFLALVPLGLAIASLPDHPRASSHAMVVGFFFGAVFWALALVWVPVVVGQHFLWAFPGYGLLLLLLGGLSGLFGLFAHTLMRKGALPPALALPLAWVGVEWLKGHFPFGLAFPWLGMGVTLSEWPQLLGLAEVLGEAGVAFWLVGVNGLVVSILLAGKPKRKLAPLVLLAVMVFVPSALGILRARTLPLEDGPRVVVVGTQVPSRLLGDPASSARASLEQVQEALLGWEAGTADLLVVPEGVVPFPLSGTEAARSMEGLETLVAGLRVPVVFGALGRVGSAGEGKGTGGLSNSAYLLSPHGGEVQRYDKTRLVPGMELGRYSRESTLDHFTSGEWVFGPLLCYESLYTGLARGRRKAGADVLVNLSSDVWFGRDDSTLGPLFLSQHPAHLVLRAVENRMPVARAANGGHSFIMDAKGELISERVFQRVGRAEARVGLFRGTTLYTRWGDWVGPASFLLTLLLLVPRRRLRRG